VSDFLTDLREELLDGLERHERRRGWTQGVVVAPAARRILIAAVAALVVFAGVQFAGGGANDEQPAAPELRRLEGFHATSAVTSDGSLWLTQYNVSDLLRIDLRTGRPRADIHLGGSPGGVIAGAGALWVQDWELGRLLKVDPATQRVVKTLTLDQVSGDLGFADGAVWFAGARGVLERINPQTVKVSRRVPLGLHPSGDLSTSVAVAGDTLWVVTGNGAVIQVDARTGTILGRTHGPALPGEFARRTAADDGGLWISSPTRREVVRIDARTRRITRFPVHGDPSPLAIVDGRVWVGTTHDTDPVTRVTVLDETDGHIVATLPVPLVAINFAPSAGGGAWVTFGEDGTVSPAALHLSAP
jgi:streptogramin lyase